jgi:hypothetical protein
MAVAMSANGIFRELVIKQITSSLLAGVLSAAIGVLLIALITRVGFSPLNRATPTRELVLLSVFLVVLTVLFETALGLFIDRKSVGQLAGHYAIWHGELWPIVLAFLAGTPFWWARWSLRASTPSARGG